MADSRLRQLQRDAASGGDLEAEARFLLERVRVGKLPAERLELAAYLGDPAARLAVSVPGPDPTAPWTRDELAGWVVGLRRWGKVSCVRAAVAAARLALPVWERQFPQDDRPHRVLGVAEDWIRCPCAYHTARAREVALRERHRGYHRARYANAARLAAQAAGEISGTLALLKRDLSFAEASALQARVEGAGAIAHVRLDDARRDRHRLELVSLGWRLEEAWEVVSELALDQEAIPLADELVETCDRLAATCAHAASDRAWRDEGLSPRGVRDAVQDELLPWALGLRDLVRERALSG